jgi:hypothetical protein
MFSYRVFSKPSHSKSPRPKRGIYQNALHTLQSEVEEKHESAYIGTPAGTLGQIHTCPSAIPYKATREQSERIISRQKLNCHTNLLGQDTQHNVKKLCVPASSRPNMCPIRQWDRCTPARTALVPLSCPGHLTQHSTVALLHHSATARLTSAAYYRFTCIVRRRITSEYSPRAASTNAPGDHSH